MRNAVRLFDTHCHIFDVGFEGTQGVRYPAPGEELALYEQWRLQAGIEHSFVVGYDEKPYAGNSAYIEELAKTRPWLNPLRYSPAGVSLGRSASAYPVTPAKARALVEQLQRQEQDGTAPRILSLNATPAALGILAETIRGLEETWFLISHLGLPGPVSDGREARETLAPLLALSGLRNLSVKISGQYAASRLPHPHSDVQILLDVLADAIGVERLVWGSDFSPALDFVTFPQAVDCRFPTGATEQERHAILFQNAHDMNVQFGIGDA